MSLPNENHELVQRARRMKLAVDGAPAPANFVYRLRKRMLGRGENTGLIERGRFDQLNLTESLLRRKALYRRTESSLRRPVLICLDMSTAADKPHTRRVVETAVWIGVVVLDLPGVELTVAPYGTTSPVQPFTQSGIGAVGSYRHRMDGLLSAAVEGADDPLGGQYRRAAAFASDAHVIVISTMPNPIQLRSVGYSSGVTVVAVRPSLVSVVNRFALVGGFSAVGGRAGLEEKLDQRYSELAESFREHRIACAVVGSSGELVDEVEAALKR